MATSRDTPGSALKARERVTLTRDIRDVPEGTHGVVKVANGLTWARYWVQFDNGHWVGSVSASDLVREGDYEEFKKRRAEEALRPKAEAAPAAPSASGEGAAGAASGAASRVPAHLLERSQNARARKAAGGDS
ncbi:MAG TPA: hypothetical protein VM143_13505 [Acidimicrobiales bacterium]|nr:hypothetical protein [Acidimicrobiales bacterium]